ncbi:MAG: hypothetical protein ACI4VI_10265 [Acutalibacteraceae bacterium]
MKRFISILLAALIALTFAACSGKTENTKGSVGEASPDKMQTILTPAEYVLYQNIFYNDQGGEYVGKEVTKMGIFTCIRDEFNSMTRYYVWGYNDNTKCCDWQWEIVPENTDNLPPVGSTVNASGIFAQDDNALDGYWIENVKIEVLSEYKKSTADIDMTTMGGTLERVQIVNMQNFKDNFEGKTVAAYGRIESPTSLQHPYYDGAFSQQFETKDEVQAFGTVVIVSGVYSGGVITDAAVSPTNDY